ncbi:MAG: hypothetical protein KDC87_22325 [Planctomycetes bacterium]|nr:hypothetical protein [Planctomycetota bacterium]MCB9870572.1 hypothetical protein [Planctomycetota bacterium]
MDSGPETLAVEQVRRFLRTSSTPSSAQFDGFVEQLHHRAARPGLTERFQLALVGIEGRTLSANELALEAARFEQSQAAYNFRFQGFRISDAQRAEANYDLVFLSRAQRVVREGTRDVYRVAVLPKNWDRTAWLVELDTETAYPLYSGQYSLDANRVCCLQSELVVRSFRPGVVIPANFSWWEAATGIEVVDSAEAALQAVLVSGSFVLPAAEDLLPGFAGFRFEVQTDPYGGERSAVLAYSDGIDHVFLRQQDASATSPEDGDTIAYLKRRCETICQFSHGGVDYLVRGRVGGGRGDWDEVQFISARIMARAVGR